VSQLQQLVTDVAARVNDPSIAYRTGKVEINRHAQLRKAIFVRPSGVLQLSVAPGRQPFGIPLSGAGTTQFVRFKCQDLIELTMSAESEDALELLFDAVVNALFEVGGPNVLVEPEQAYEWTGEDSVSAGANVNRAPEIKFRFKMNRVSHPSTRPFAVLDAANATVTELDSSVAITVPSA
jgi:hypothetical protein